MLDTRNKVIISTKFLHTSAMAITVSIYLVKMPIYLETRGTSRISLVVHHIRRRTHSSSSSRLRFQRGGGAEQRRGMAAAQGSGVPAALALSSGHTMPSVGLGVWRMDSPAIRDLIHSALRIGYRHFDCAGIEQHHPQPSDLHSFPSLPFSSSRLLLRSSRAGVATTTSWSVPELPICNNLLVCLCVTVEVKIGNRFGLVLFGDVNISCSF